MSNPAMELEILEGVVKLLRFATPAGGNVELRPIRTASTDDDEIRIYVSPSTTDIVTEASSHKDYLFVVNVDIDVPDDDRQIVFSTMRVHREVVRVMVPESLKSNPFNLSYLTRMTDIGAEELSVNDDAELPNMVRRTTWEFVYRSTRADFAP